VTKQSAELQPMAAEDFFDRARARLTLNIPPALTDPMAQGARGDVARRRRNLFRDEKALAPANCHGGGNPSPPRAKTLSVNRRPTGSLVTRRPEVLR
jgi:hypothetical protein